MHTDGAFYLSACGHVQAGGKGLFRAASRFPMKALERLFRHKVLRMLLDAPSANCPRPTRTSSASSRMRSGIAEAAGNVVPGASARIALSGLRPFPLHTAGIPPQAARRLPPSCTRIENARPGPKPNPICWVFFFLTHNSAHCYSLLVVNRIPPVVNKIPTRISATPGTAPCRSSGSRARSGCSC